MASRDTEEWLWITGRDLQRLADELTNPRPKVAGSRFWEPRADLLEEAHRFLIKVELPGVRSEEIHVLYVPERHAVLVRGTRPDDLAVGEGVGIHQIEILYGDFEREIKLPASRVDGQGIRAQYRSGFLIVMIPKMENIEPRRTVTVKRV